MANGNFAGGDGTESNPYLIEDAFDLDAVRNELSAYYKLIADINLDVAPFNKGGGWEPIEDLTGVLDGNRYPIINLFIYRSGRTGLFANNNGTIKDLFLQGEVSGGDYTGGLVGANNGNIQSCHVHAIVDGGNQTGVMTGNNNGLIENSYTSGVATGSSRVAGFTGQNWSGEIYNCYSIATAPQGFTARTGAHTLENSFWDIEAAGTNSSSGGNGVKGLTTQEMQTAQTFIEAGWHEELSDDGGQLWILEDGEYPKLSFIPPTTDKILLSSQQEKVKSIDFDNNAIVDVPDQSEESFIEYGIDTTIEGFESDYTEKHYINNSPTPLGEGKVFEQPLDVDKIIKSVKIN